jgi:hypothetical protein
VNNISTISFKIGIIPAWWKPIPLCSKSTKLYTWGNSLSSSSNLDNAFFTKSLICFLSESPMKDHFLSTSCAKASTYARLKKNTMHGSKFYF